MAKNKLKVSELEENLILEKFDNKFNITRWVGTQRDQIRLKKLSLEKIKKIKLLPGVYERIPFIDD